MAELFSGIGGWSEAARAATWFIDPPYQYGGHVYKENNLNIDYKSLSAWCEERHGQVIVCENQKANWMNFRPMTRQKGSSKVIQQEVIWSNQSTVFDNLQLSLI